VVLARLICHSAAAGTQGATDQSAFATTHQAAHNSSADCRSPDNLRASVMLMIAGPLGRNSSPMTALSSGLLARRDQRKGEH